MNTKLYTEPEVREIFLNKIEGRAMTDVAEEMDVTRQYVWALIAGKAPLQRKALRWLGFEVARGLYRKAKVSK